MVKISGFYLGFCAVCALLAPVPAYAAGQDPSGCALLGVVVDVTGLPLPGVSVTAAPNTTVITDAEGKYCFRTAPIDRRLVRFSLKGFETVERQIDANAPPPITIDVTLRPGSADETVVTATRTSRRIDDVPVRTEVIGTAAMRATASRTLADAVEYTTGVRVESNCQNCNFSQIRLLGLEGPYTQILIDGQPVISSLAQVYGIEQIPARMIERIEIVKGGGSALYGSGSVGGVINVISREPARRAGLFETRIDWMDGQPGHSTSGSYEWASPSQRTNASAFLQVDSVRPLDLTGDGFTEVSRRSLTAGGGRASRYLMDGRGKLTGEFTVFAEDRRGGNALDLPPQQADIAEWIDSRRIGASATWFHSVSPGIDYRLTLAAADTDRDSYYGTGQDPHAFGVTANRMYVADAQVNHYAGRHTLSWGAQATSEDLLDRQPAYDRLMDATYRNAGLFVQDDWAFARGWELIYGVRADKHSEVDRLIASPRLALMISPVESLDIRASVARGFRAPQAFDEDLHLTSVGGEVRFITLDPGLREERSTNYMLGAEWKPEAGRGQALLEMNGFYTRLTDLFLARNDDNPVTDPIEYLKVNHGGARVYGVEMNAGWGIGDDFILQGGVVLQRALYDDAEPDFGSHEFFRTPRHYGNLSLTWRTQAAGTLFAGMRYTGEMLAPHFPGYIPDQRLEKTPAFFGLDASIAYPIRRSANRQITVTIAGKNLTNAYQRDVDQGPLRDANYVYGPRFPRSFSIGLRAEF